MSSNRGRWPWANALVPQKRLIALKLHYFFFFAGQAILLPYIPIIQKALGLTEREIGIINGVMPFLGFIAVYTVSRLADRLRRHKVILIILCALCSIAHACILSVPGTVTANSRVTEIQLKCSPDGATITRSQLDHLFTLNNDSDDDILQCAMQCSDARFYLQAPDVENGTEHINETVKFSSSFTRPEIADLLLGEGNNKSIYHDNTYAVVMNHDQGLTCHVQWNMTCSAQCTGANPNHKNEFGLTFILFFVVYFVAHMTYSPCTSLCDTLAYKSISTHNYQWGWQRCFGTIGFITASVVSVLLQEFVGEPNTQMKYDLNIYIFFALIILAAVAAKFIYIGNDTETEERQAMELEEREKHEDDTSETERPKSILKDVRVLTLIAAMFIFGLNFGLVFAFLFWYMADLQLSSSDFETMNLVMGLAVAVTGVMELVFMIASGHIVKKLGEVTCLIIAFVAYSLRFFLYSQLSTLGSLWWVLAIETLYGPSFGLMFAAATSYANRISPPGRQATLQGLASGFHFNIGWGVGALAGGNLYTLIGGSYMFLAFSVLSLVAALGLLMMNLLVLRRFREPTQKMVAATAGPGETLLGETGSENTTASGSALTTVDDGYESAATAASMGTGFLRESCI